MAAAGASIRPMAVLNAVYSGGWTGAAAEHVFMGAGPMWLRWFVNGTTWTLDNVSPPVFPFASAWNRVVEALTPASLAALVGAQTRFCATIVRSAPGRPSIRE